MSEEDKDQDEKADRLEILDSLDQRIKELREGARDLSWHSERLRNKARAKLAMSMWAKEMCDVLVELLLEPTLRARLWMRLRIFWTPSGMLMV